MFDEIKAWLEGGEPSGSGDEGDQVQLAAAALLVEAAHIDDKLDSRERAVIDGILERRFTHIINERFSLEQRIELIEMLWEVVYADGTVDALEDTLLRRVGGLIYVPDRERGTARQRVAQRWQHRAPAGPESNEINRAGTLSRPLVLPEE